MTTISVKGMRELELVSEPELESMLYLEAAAVLKAEVGATEVQVDRRCAARW
jgi:hypothetical protein